MNLPHLPMALDVALLNRRGWTPLGEGDVAGKWSTHPLRPCVRVGFDPSESWPWILEWRRLDGSRSYVACYTVGPLLDLIEALFAASRI